MKSYGHSETKHGQKDTLRILKVTGLEVMGTDSLASKCIPVDHQRFDVKDHLVRFHPINYFFVKQ